MKKIKVIFALLVSLLFGLTVCACKKTEAPTTEKPTTTQTDKQTDGTTTEDPGTTTEEPGSTTEDPGTTTEDPGTTTEDPGTVTEDPGTTSSEVITQEDVYEEGINITRVLSYEVKDMEDNSFETTSGIFAIEGGSYENQAVSLGDEQYMYTKVQIKKMEAKYSYGNKETFPELERNSKLYLRFEASGDGGGVQIFMIASNGALVEIMEPIILSDQVTKYQIVVPSAFSEEEVGLVFKNPAPEDSMTTSFIKSVSFADEIDPKNQVEYFNDVLEWEEAQFNGEDGFDPYVISPSFGWSGFKGISRGDQTHNYVAYIDSFGAALEYGNLDNDKSEEGVNLLFEGTQIYGKFTIPEGTKKLTYWIGHVNDPSAYRIQLFYNGQFVNLTESSDAVNTQYVKSDEGWRLTTQPYNGQKTFEVAIPSEYVGKDVVIVFSAKYNAAASYGIRINNIAFSSEDIIIPAAIVEGINIDAVNALEAVSLTTFNFAESNCGFISLNNASFETGFQLVGGDKFEDSDANAIAAAKVTLGTFNYLRVFMQTEEAKSVYVRLRAIAFDTKEVSDLCDWTLVSGEHILQLQSFPTTFVGTVGLVVEYKYLEKSTLTINKIEFAQNSRDENGYDLEAINNISPVEFPSNGTFLFDQDGFAKWSVFTANDDSNTKGMLNNIWAQLQSTNNQGEYSVLLATKTEVLSSSKVSMKVGLIGESTLTGYVRLRAILPNGTIVNFTKEGLTNESGWFNVSTGECDPGCDYGWGGLRTLELDFNQEVAGKEVILLIEYDKEQSTSWNVLIESLIFVDPETTKIVYEAGRDENGYDYKTISELTATQAPENGVFTFDGEELAKWTILTANDTENTKGMANAPFVQLQATDTTGAYSVLIARCVPIGDYDYLLVKSAIIGNVGDSAYIRVRAMLSDNTIVTFTKEGLTNEAGWFNAMSADATNAYGWGPVDTVSIDIPESVKNQTVKLIIEYDKEPSSTWNVLFESLTLSK